MMRYPLSDVVHTTFGLAVAVILGVAITTACWKVSTLAGYSLAKVKRRSISAFSSENAGVLLAFPTMPEARLVNGGALPDLSGAIAWLSSVPLSGKSLRGKVVLVDIWTYSCINSLRQLPYMKAWAAKYKDQGLVIIGVHSPEFGFERVRSNVETAVRDLNIAYPIAIDSNHAIWEAFNNEYWPADYFVDGKGRIRYHHFGEGDYEESESPSVSFRSCCGKTESRASLQIRSPYLLWGLKQRRPAMSNRRRPMLATDAPNASHPTNGYQLTREKPTQRQRHFP